MTVSSNDTVSSTHYIDINSDLADVAGLGSGSTGYGMQLLGYENYKSIVVEDAQISKGEWNSLKNTLDSVRQFQSTAATFPTNASINKNDVIYANTTDGVIGINEFYQVLDDVKAHFQGDPSGRSVFFTATTGQTEVRSPRTGVWGKVGNPQVDCRIKLTFDGGYYTTDANGNSVQASGADHLRHFFNIGCDVRLSSYLSGSTVKDSNWATMLANAGQLVIGRTGNYQLGGSGGTLENPSLGAFDLGTNETLLYTKFGTDEYAENRYQIYGKRSGTNALEFSFYFDDFDVGGYDDPDPKAGAKVDEFVFELGGNMAAGVDLKYTATGSPVSVPKPSYTVTRDLNFT